jgi:Na+/glutamate symporter
MNNATIGTIGAGIGGIALGSVLGATVTRSYYKRKAKRKKAKSSKSHRKDSKKAKHNYTSHRRIHRTKTGQPYIILASGKARFIKKKSARTSRKRKGGRY